MTICVVQIESCVSAMRLEYHPFWGLPTLTSPLVDFNVTVGAKRLELPTLPSPFGDFNEKDHRGEWSFLGAKRLELPTLPFPFGDFNEKDQCGEWSFVGAKRLELPTSSM